MNEYVVSGTNLPELMTRWEVAAFLRCSTRTIQRRPFPKVLSGGRRLYRRSDILASLKLGVAA